MREGPVKKGGQNGPPRTPRPNVKPGPRPTKKNKIDKELKAIRKEVRRLRDEVRRGPIGWGDSPM